LNDGEGVIGGAVIGNKQLVLGAKLLENTFDLLLDKGGAVVGRHANADHDLFLKENLLGITHFVL
jgi:hypothetical protein